MNKYNSIVFSGLPGSGKSTLVNALTGLLFVDERNIFSMRSKWNEKWKTLYPNEEKSFEEFWRNTTLQENREMDSEVREFLKQGHVIGDMRYTLACEGLPALCVFVTADLDIRAERNLSSPKYKDKTIIEIKNILYGRERDELKMGKELYGSDYDFRNPEYYHLVLNSGKLSVNEEVGQINQALFGD